MTGWMDGCIDGWMGLIYLVKDMAFLRSKFPPLILSSIKKISGAANLGPNLFKLIS